MSPVILLASNLSTLQLRGQYAKILCSLSVGVTDISQDFQLMLVDSLDAAEEFGNCWGIDKRAQDLQG